MVMFMVMFRMFHVVLTRAADLGENRLRENAEEDHANDGQRNEARVNVPRQLTVDGFEHEKDEQAKKQ